MLKTSNPCGLDRTILLFADLHEIAPRCFGVRAEIGVQLIPAGETRFRPRPDPSQPLAAADRGLEDKPHELSVD